MKNRKRVLNAALLSLFLFCAAVFVLTGGRKVYASGPVSGGTDYFEWSYNESTKTLTFARTQAASSIKVTIPGTTGEVSQTDAYENYSSYDNREWKHLRQEVQTLVIGEGIGTIYDSAFCWFTNLTSVKLPSSLEQIRGGVFAHTRKLKSIQLPSGLTYIGGHVFYDSGLTSITIPNSVTTFQNAIFKDCKSLKTVMLPSNITALYGDLFKGCTSLEAISIPIGVTRINGNAFYGCTSLQKVTFPSVMSSPLEIGEDAFFGCTSLKTFWVPDETTTIGTNAFRNCTSLEWFFVPNKNTEFPSNLMFDDAPAEMLLITPEGSKAWNAFAGKVNRIVDCWDGFDPEINLIDLSSLSFEFSGKLTYNAREQIPDVRILVDPNADDETQKYLFQNRYTLDYENNTAPGLMTVTARPSGSWPIVGTLTGTCRIYPAPLANTNDSSISLTNIENGTYNGKAWKPVPAVKITLEGGTFTLKNGTDFTLSYKNNVNAGTATVLVNGKGKYTGTATGTFQISPAALSKAKAAAIPSQTWTGKARKPVPGITFNGTALKSKKDFTVTYKNNKKVGKATATIKGKGNFTGTLKKSFKIIPKGTKISKLTTGTKALTVKWKKQKKQTDGYELQYGTSKSFGSGSKKVKVKKNTADSKTIKKLKAKKKYFVRIRTYKKVGKKTWYSKWSKAKSARTK